MDLEQVIADSVNDAISDETPDLDSTEQLDASPEPSDASESPAEAEPVAEAEESAEVASPAKQEAAEATSEEPQDEFSKLVGMQQTGVGGRENRIPYTRVKKIVGKAEGAAESRVAEAVLGRKLNAGEKAVDAVKAYVAKLPELETKVTEYEARLERVGQFENILQNDPKQFLTMLAKVPAYADFFEFVKEASRVMQGQAQSPQEQPQVTPDDEMPEPDDTLSDGSRGYSMNGLRSLLDWNAQRAAARVTAQYEQKLKELEQRYAPIADEWQLNRIREQARPVIEKKLAEARTWHLFNESEEEILDALRKDPQISLEGAYRQVVFPKLVAERNQMRQNVLEEVKAAPVSTSVSARTATKPKAQSAGPRDLEDIIREQIATLK